MQKPVRLALGVVVAFGVGFGASRLGIAVPAPPALIGALLVVTMTLGYVWAGRYLARQPAACGDPCGGPDGIVDPKRSGDSNVQPGSQ